MTILLTAVGTTVVVFVLVDIFKTLLYPDGQGRLCKLLLSAVWRLFRLFPFRLRAAVGPAAMLCVLATWVALLTAGWSFIYYPQLPDGFTYNPGLDRRTLPAALEAVYISAMTLTR